MLTSGIMAITIFSKACLVVYIPQMQYLLNSTSRYKQNTT